MTVERRNAGSRMESSLIERLGWGPTGSRTFKVLMINTAVLHKDELTPEYFGNWFA